MSKKNHGKKFNEEFKKTVVGLYHSGSSVKDLSSDYGVTEVSIYQNIPVGKEEDYSPIVKTRILKNKLYSFRVLN